MAKRLRDYGKTSSTIRRNPAPIIVRLSRSIAGLAGRAIGIAWVVRDSGEKIFVAALCFSRPKQQRSHMPWFVRGDSRRRTGGRAGGGGVSHRNLCRTATWGEFPSFGLSGLQSHG